MQIKEAKESDIPEILQVLKASLGETSSKKTEEIWRYKHVNNPFGKSLVLLAIENNQIIGVRAFMRWKWQKGEKLYSCFRAVDTATHPDHQGKGVFKMLTLKALEIAKKDKDHFIFNTPNNQSLPGYLKMQWVIVNKIKVNIYPAFFLKWFGKNTSINSKSNTQLKKNIQELCYVKNRELKKEIEKFFTPKSLEYLNWRYDNNPMQSYEIHKSQGIYIAGYVKQHKYFKEFRLSEAIVEANNRKAAISIVRDWVRKHEANIVSTAAGVNILSKIKISGGFGPALTVRNLNLPPEEYRHLLKLESFSYTLGDLELF